MTLAPATKICECFSTETFPETPSGIYRIAHTQELSSNTILLSYYHIILRVFRHGHLPMKSGVNLNLSQGGFLRPKPKPKNLGFERLPGDTKMSPKKIQIPGNIGFQLWLVLNSQQIDTKKKHQETNKTWLLVGAKFFGHQLLKTFGSRQQPWPGCCWPARWLQWQCATSGNSFPGREPTVQF